MISLPGARSLLLLTCIAASASFALSQSPAKLGPKQTPEDENKESPANTYYVSCGNELPYKARTAISRVIESPDRENAAIARVRLIVNGQSCTSKAELFVRLGKTKPFKRVLLKSPEDGESTNGIKLIDWSADGNFLLFETVGWPMGDADAEQELALFDTRTAKIIHPYLANVFTTTEDCNLVIRAVGFVDSSHYVIRAHSSLYYDPAEDEPRNAACPTFDRQWSVGLKDTSLERLPDNYKAHKFGHYATPPKPDALSD